MMLIVAILFFVLVGMLVLVFDLGRVVAIKRDMVNAADSAALAAAQQCALGHGSAQAKVAASDLTSANDADATVESVTFSTLECEPGALATTDPKIVTVRSAVDVEYFFAQIFGLSSSTYITEASAQWGAAASARPVPFVVQQGAFQGPCKIPDVAPGTTCAIWFDNDQFGGSTFGTLNLNKWDIDPTANVCTNKEQGANNRYAEVGGFDGATALPPLRYPDPTWVCAGTGVGSTFGRSPALDVPGPDGLSKSVGKVIAFPVTAPPCTQQGGYCDSFNVVGFARLLLRGVFTTGNVNNYPPECGIPPANNSSHACIVTKWVGGGFGSAGVIGGLDFGLRTIRLVD